VKWRIALLAGALVVVAAGAVATVGFSKGTSATQPRSELPPATAKVTKQSLLDQQTETGTLGHGEETSVPNKLVGTVTWLPEVGTVLKRDDVLYRVNDLPVLLAYGAMPAYRDLAVGVEGTDVRQLEENLAALGYRGFTVDDDYTDGTATAVKKWQKDHGLPQTGVVELGRVVFAPGEIQVAAHKAEVGDAAQPGQSPLTYTGTAPAVTVSLDLDEARLAMKGAKVKVTLPNGKTTEGTIAKVATVIEPATQDQQETTKIEVTVSLTDQNAISGLDQAQVSVAFTAAQRPDVLTVPVAALLALPQGGYGLQVVEGSSTRMLPVQVGLFASGRVEVTGDGLSAGMTVGMPT
jgi:membrane fusion protein, multidrug efflux system